MTLKNRSLITIDDVSNPEVEAVFSLADEMSAAMTEQSKLCQGKIMASLFFEPSTRTRLSFEAAMHRLGGSVISVADAKASSLAKGESLADMARVVSSYADIIVIRHPWEGAAKVVADYAGIPVINAGDGGHQHPTQTLCDLYTLKKERGEIKGLKIALWGDLKYGRTTHSLIFALAKFGANILFCPSPGLEVPPHVIKKLVAEYGGEVQTRDTLKKTSGDERLSVDAIYTTPTSPHQLAMMPGVNIQLNMENGVDALYVTRTQKERFTKQEEAQSKGSLQVINKELLRGKAFKETLVMHPLPRVDELAYDMDTDPRSMYFKQAARGVPVRMALLSLILGVKEMPANGNGNGTTGIKYPDYTIESGVRCPNPKCVSIHESEAQYIKHQFKIVNTEPLTLRCVYCEHGFDPAFVASLDWHEGKLANKIYHRADSHWTKKIKPENLIIFNSEEDAQASGFKPSRSLKRGNE